MKTMVLTAILTIGLTAVAGAAVIPAPIGDRDSMLIKIAEGCGPGYWRGPGGRCHPFAVNRACPPGYHLGPERRRCWPN
jgi:hypothetical protein